MEWEEIVFFTNAAGDLGFASTNPEYDAHKKLRNRNVITEAKRNEDAELTAAIFVSTLTVTWIELPIQFKIQTLLYPDWLIDGSFQNRSFWNFI